MIDETQFVTALYQGILGREPDPTALERYSSSIVDGASLDGIVRAFVNSEEYARRSKGRLNRYPFDGAPPLTIDLDLTPEDGRRLWAHVERAWSNLGATEPYFSVITDKKWKTEEIARRQDHDAFYAKGRSTVVRIDAWLARNNVSTDRLATCVELGCGVGRCTVWLARRFERVVAFDVSAPHLALAQERAEAEGLRNIEFVHVRSKDDLRHLDGADLFYSEIVLQHNPPPLIGEILDRAFAGLRPKGVAFFQVPTYRSGYAFNLGAYLEDLQDRGMEGHVFPQEAVFDLAWRHGVKPLEVEPDNLMAQPGSISTTFLLEKVGAGNAGSSGF